MDTRQLRRKICKTTSPSNKIVHGQRPVQCKHFMDTPHSCKTCLWTLHVPDNNSHGYSTLQNTILMDGSSSLQHFLVTHTETQTHPPHMVWWVWCVFRGVLFEPPFWSNVPGQFNHFRAHHQTWVWSVWRGFLMFFFFSTPSFCPIHIAATPPPNMFAEPPISLDTAAPAQPFLWTQPPREIQFYRHRNTHTASSPDTATFAQNYPRHTSRAGCHGSSLDLSRKGGI